MISKLVWMQLAADQQKKQRHEKPQFPCSAYYTDWHKGEIDGVPWHWHRELEFMMVKKGAVRVQFGDQEADLKEGEGFFCNTRFLHRVMMRDCEVCCVNSLVFDAGLISGGPGTIFDGKYIYPLLSARALAGGAFYLSDHRHLEILGHIQAAYENCQREANGYEYEVRYHLAKALLLILEGNRALLSLAGKEEPQMERLRGMLAYVHTHYASAITVSDLAGSVGICERECQRCFRNFLHQSPMDYVRQYRIQMAGKMLLETRESILEVGLAVGFSNPSHFCKVFRSQMHCSPARFRKSFEQN
ncbi:MAG: AraC family transcriptional regulator [Lachnospiraceae bacterium]|jgi:AraC-like DNA-binding protein|nr:AraC family transcriptional regulator [Lachnospiraceae bacterium]